MIMEIEFSWIEPSLVVSRPSGKASVEGFVALFEALVSRPEFGPGVKILTDLSKLDMSALKADDIQRIADVRKTSSGGMEMPAALVVGPSSPAKYGLARMIGARVDEQDKGTVRVFESFDEGLAWLRALDVSSQLGSAVDDAAVDIDPAR